jgi:hypothetical protein
MKAQRRPVDRPGDAARAEISLGPRADDRHAGAKQPAGGLGRIAWRGRHVACYRESGGQAQKPARLMARVVEAREVTIKGDEVDEIAMLGGLGIGLMCS